MNMNSVTAGVLLAMMVSAAFAQTRTPPQAARPAPPAASARQAQPAASADDRTGDMGIKGSEVVARVGTSDVTAEEMRAAVAFLDPRQQAALARDPALLSQTVRTILANRLVLKEAMAKKWDQQPAVIAQLARARESVIVETYLQSVSAPPENFPNDAEVKAVYDANASTFLVPRRFQLAQIVVTLPKDADKAAEETARKKVDDVLKKAKQPGADFAALARSDSDDKTTAEQDGEIGWIADPDLRPEIRSQVAGLAKSGLTDPVRLDDGWHILKLLDTEAAHTRSFSEVRDALVQKIRAERADANRRAYVAELLKQTPPVINEIALSNLLGAKNNGAPSR
jgi:peptidylprolyl isomerase